MGKNSPQAGNIEFGGRLRILRTQTTWNQRELAVAAGEAVAQLQRWERGEAEPRLTALQHLADALGVSLDVLGSYAPVPQRPKGPAPAQLCADSRIAEGDRGQDGKVWTPGGRCKGCPQGPGCRTGIVADRTLKDQREPPVKETAP